MTTTDAPTYSYASYPDRPTRFITQVVNIVLTACPIWQQENGSWLFVPTNGQLQLSSETRGTDPFLTVHAVLKISGTRMLSGNRTGSQLATDRFRYTFDATTGELHRRDHHSGRDAFLPMVTEAVQTFRTRLVDLSPATPTDTTGDNR